MYSYSFCRNLRHNFSHFSRDTAIFTNSPLLYIFVFIFQLTYSQLFLCHGRGKLRPCSSACHHCAPPTIARAMNHSGFYVCGHIPNALGEGMSLISHPFTVQDMIGWLFALQRVPSTGGRVYCRVYESILKIHNVTISNFCNKKQIISLYILSKLELSG